MFCIILCIYIYLIEDANGCENLPLYFQSLMSYTFTHTHTHTGTHSRCTHTQLPLIF